MVTMTRPKVNILERLRSKQSASQQRPSGIGHIHNSYPSNKGQYLGHCNRSKCLKPGASWYNNSTRLYYCFACALELNSDSVNRQEAQRLYGHPLLTEGRYDPNKDYRTIRY